MQWFANWLPSWFASWFGGTSSPPSGLVQAPAILSGTAQLSGSAPPSGGGGGFGFIFDWWRTLFKRRAPVTGIGRLRSAPARVTGTASLTPPDDAIDILLTVI
jgi:hypothetical protein